jgi:hypothetical protein
MTFISSTALHAYFALAEALSQKLFFFLSRAMLWKLPGPD